MVLVAAVYASTMLYGMAAENVPPTFGGAPAPLALPAMAMCGRARPRRPYCVDPPCTMASGVDWNSALDRPAPIATLLTVGAECRRIADAERTTRLGSAALGAACGARRRLLTHGLKKMNGAAAEPTQPRAAGNAPLPCIPPTPQSRQTLPVVGVASMASPLRLPPPRHVLPGSWHLPGLHEAHVHPVADCRQFVHVLLAVEPRRLGFGSKSRQQEQRHVRI